MHNKSSIKVYGIKKEEYFPEYYELLEISTQ
jgi:hypothetical protein